MATTEERQTEVLESEEEALDPLETGELPAEDLLSMEEPPEPPLPFGRLAIVVAFSVMAAAVMVGGVYKGATPRMWAAIAGLLGIGLAILALKIKNAIVMNLAILGGIIVIGILMTIPGGTFSDILDLNAFVKDSLRDKDVVRPPAQFTLGWRAIVGWLMGGLGFTAAWVAMQIRKPALGLMVPMPIVAIGAISVTDEAQIPSGLAALVLFAIGLGVLSGVQIGEAEQRDIKYELRRAIRAIPMVAIITVALFFLTRFNILFPEPLFDPTQDAQKPKTVPLTKVPDRVLFTVESSITGPWRMGGLDVYEDDAWLLPPFKDNRIAEVPRSGIVDQELQAGHRATFRMKDLTGVVLPGLPNLVGLVATGPVLAYDSRTGNIRLGEGTIVPELEYTVTAARIPSVDELKNVVGSIPKDAQPFLKMPPPPPAVQDLLARAPATPPWDRLDFVRNELLQNVVATGAGTPVAVPPAKVSDMLVGSKTGTPYEIVAGQAMLARWAGIPARIGYGFDGGEKVGPVFEVRPKHGASFLEVYFPGYKWLPIIGTPLQAQSSVGSDQTQRNENVLPSDDIAVKVVVAYQTDPRTFLIDQIQRIVAIVLPIILLLLLLYFTYPALRKSIVRARRRTWAQHNGDRARIAVAYADWRDLATDFGYKHQSDTPLMFLDRVVSDQEHTELAWLATRTLWGDLQGEIKTEDARAAEELSRSLRKRMSQAHTGTLRFVAAVSRLSLKFPYAPNLGEDKLRKERGDAKKAA
ncbi:MAG TPA: transglutaminase domain-containing protein [Actinomycetota bacterium]|nr:transglutaminase domain-containing protein [Actinomycetota bacterium]